MTNECLSLEPGYIPVRIRRRVLQRDGGRCVWCGGPEDRRVSHFIQKRAGGETSYYNLVTTCELCKRNRQYLSPSEFIAKLKVEESEVFRDMAMQIQVTKQNGDVIKGEVDDMPNPNAPYAKGFWLRYPGNGEREFIFFEQGMRIRQLGGRQIRNKD